MEQKGFFARIHNDGFTWKDSILIILLQSVVIFVLGNFLCIPLWLLFSNFSEGGTNALVVTVGEYMLFLSHWIIILLFCAAYKSQRPILKAIGTGVKGNKISMLLLGLLIGFATNGVCILLAALHKDIFLYFDSFPVVPIILIFISVFVQSSAEELFCRGFLYQRLRKTYRSPWVAILVNPLFFSLMHVFNPGVSPVAIINIYVVGVVFGFMVYYFDSLWMAMAMHAAWNFTQNIIFGLPNSGVVSTYSIFKLDASTARDSVFYNVAFGVEATIAAMVVLLITGIIIGFIGEKKKLRPTDIWQ